MIIYNLMKKIFKNIKSILNTFIFTFNFKSIKDKVFYFSFLVSLSIMLLVIFTSYSFTYNTIKNTSISREINRIELISNQTDIILSSAESLATNLIVNTDVQAILKDCSINNTSPNKYSKSKIKVALDTLTNNNDIIFGAILHTTNEISFQTDNSLMSLVNSDYTYMHFNNWYGDVSDIYNRSYFYLSKEIFDMNTGALIGYLEIFIAESFLSKNYTSNGSNSKYLNLFLINDQGIITSSSRATELKTNIFETRPDLKRVIDTNSFEIIEYVSAKKVTLMLYYDKLKCNIVADLYLKDIIHEKETLIISLAFLTLIGLIFSYILSKTISKSITKPINNLSNAIIEVEKGNWSTEIDITSLDEIGILSKKFNHLIIYIKNLISTIQYEQNKKKEFELELIQLQIKPHFLYNSLENISALAELDRNDDVVDMVSNLSTFYRGVLNKGNNIITLKEEIDLTKSYLNIMKVRYFDIFDYDLDYDFSLNDYSCLKLLVQPLIENSIYHGLKNCEFKGNIQISISKIDDNIKFIIKDSGIGMTKDELTKLLEGRLSTSSKGGFAVKNTIERLNLFYPNNCIFNIESEKQIGTIITIIIPAIKKEMYFDEYTFS